MRTKREMEVRETAYLDFVPCFPKCSCCCEASYPCSYDEDVELGGRKRA